MVKYPFDLKSNFYCIIIIFDSKQEIGEALAVITNTFDILLNLMFLASDVDQQSQLAKQLVPIIPILSSGLTAFGMLIILSILIVFTIFIELFIWVIFLNYFLQN